VDEEAQALGPLPEAPAWRRRVARAIDTVAALAVFALFLTPVIAVQSHREPVASLLETSAWIYAAIFVALAIVWVAGRRRRRPYVTVGMSIMNLFPLRTGKTVRLVCNEHAPASENDVRGRSAVTVAVVLILAGVVFFIFELLAFT